MTVDPWPVLIRGAKADAGALPSFIGVQSACQARPRTRKTTGHEKALKHRRPLLALTLHARGVLAAPGVSMIGVDAGVITDGNARLVVRLPDAAQLWIE